jgi:hypothetical protein
MSSDIRRRLARPLMHAKSISCLLPTCKARVFETLARVAIFTMLVSACPSSKNAEKAASTMRLPDRAFVGAFSSRTYKERRRFAKLTR